VEGEKRMMVKELGFRSPRLEDAQQTLELMERCDVHDYGEPDSDMEDLIHGWGQIDLEQDAWLAFTPGGQLVGYAVVLPWGKDVWYDFYVDPSWEGEELGSALLARCEKRGVTFAAERGAASEVFARTFIAHVSQQDQGIAKEAGFEPGRYFFQMQIELAGELPEVEWPEGVSVRNAIIGQDEGEIYELIQEAFEQPGRERPSFEAWKDFALREDIFDPELWFLAVAGGEIIGACLCYAYSAFGWVRQLGVDGGWRRKGIGGALLRQAFASFKRRGFDKAGLSVESRRPDAYAFYQRVGMKVAKQYDEYAKPIRVGDG
jgi:ribosomal protein S18 acetylase RimI-like enzyme